MQGANYIIKSPKPFPEMKLPPDLRLYSAATTYLLTTWLICSNAINSGDDPVGASSSLDTMHRDKPKQTMQMPTPSLFPMDGSRIVRGSLRRATDSISIGTGRSSKVTTSGQDITTKEVQSSGSLSGSTEHTITFLVLGDWGKGGRNGQLEGNSGGGGHGGKPPKDKGGKGQHGTGDKDETLYQFNVSQAMGAYAQSMEIKPSFLLALGNMLKHALNRYCKSA